MLPAWLWCRHALILSTCLSLSCAGDIMMTPIVREAMDLQAQAERQKRQQILASQGFFCVLRCCVYKLSANVLPCVCLHECVSVE